MSDDVTVARRAVIHGRVQGVFFRDTCRREADASGIAGYVRNDPDGTVTAEFEGAADSVEAMLEWARQGPPRAVVTHVDVEELPPSGRRGFDIV